MGFQWKELPIEKDETGRPEIHFTRIYMLFKRLESAGCITAIFVGSVFKLRESNLLDTGVIHGDGTTTSAKKGGDNLGYSVHKHMRGDKVVAFCDRNCNVISPFASYGAAKREILPGVEHRQHKGLNNRGLRIPINLLGSKRSRCGSLNRRNRHNDFYRFMGK